jgi:thiamine pyrophosphokinase
MKVIMVASGTAPTQRLIDDEMQHGTTTIVAADGGGNCLWRYGVIPHCLVGDCDSITPEALNYFTEKKVSIVRYAIEKDETDGQLALRWALSLLPREIVILGALDGDRVDHLLVALGLLSECVEHGVKAYLRDEKQTVRLVDQSTILKGMPGTNFSLQAYGGPVNNLSLSGSKYELKDYSLGMGDGRTIANELLNDRVRITFSTGILLITCYGFQGGKSDII